MTSTSQASISKLMRAFEQGGGYVELRLIIKELASLEAIDALCAIAEDQVTPPDLREEVLHALSPFPTNATIALFLRELDASSRKRKQLAIDTLGRWRYHNAAPVLCAQFQRLKQTALRLPLLVALGRIANDETLFVIQQWLHIAPLSILEQDLKQLAKIPQVKLLEQLKTFCVRLTPSALEDENKDEDRNRLALFAQATTELAETIREHQRTQLSPYREQLEEVLFE